MDDVEGDGAWWYMGVTTSGGPWNKPEQGRGEAT